MTRVHGRARLYVLARRIAADAGRDALVLTLCTPPIARTLLTVALIVA